MRHITVLIIAFFLFTLAPASAQTNPAQTTCGLPAGGLVVTSVTYTLTGHCTLTETLKIASSTASADVTVTIIGGGLTITGPPAGASDRTAIQLQQYGTLHISDVTIVGAGRSGKAAITLTNSRQRSTFTNITFRDSIHTAIQFNNESSNRAVTHSLSSVLIEGGSGGTYYHVDEGIPLGLHTHGPVSLNINNIVLRNVVGGNAAIGANEGYLPSIDSSIGTITLSGCLTADGVFPRVYYGDIVDNATRPCPDSITIGNGGSTAIQYPQAPVDRDCGMPLSGYIYGTQTFNLRRDCALTGTLIIPHESNVVINGNTHTIDASGFNDVAFYVAGPFRLNNVVVSGSIGWPVLSFLANELTFQNTIFRGNSRPLVIQDSIASMDTVLIENHTQTATIPNALYVNLSAQVTIRDTVFRNNTGGSTAIFTGASYQYGPDPVVWLQGCITFEGNTPSDISDAGMFLKDDRRGACPPDMEILIASPNQPSPGHTSYNAPPGVCDGKPTAVPVGAIACIFREDEWLTVYRIDEMSRGHFTLGVTQAQVEANGLGMVGASVDGFAAVYKLEDGNVLVSVGPDWEGKVAHITLDGSVYGRVLSFTTSYGTAPSTAGVSHTKVLHGCMVRTKYMLNFRDGPAGERITNFADYHGIRQDWLPPDVTLTALERSSEWFKVDYHGTQGWISADYVERIRNCG